jgi:hypothetical protein
MATKGTRGFSIYDCRIAIWDLGLISGEVVTITI